jgi:hypothetical protein
MREDIAFGQFQKGLGPWEPPPEPDLGLHAQGNGYAGEAAAFRAISDEPVFPITALAEESCKCPQAEFEPFQMEEVANAQDAKCTVLSQRHCGQRMNLFCSQARLRKELDSPAPDGAHSCGGLVSGRQPDSGAPSGHQDEGVDFS